MLSVLSENQDKDFMRKCDRRYKEKPSPNNSWLFILLVAQTVVFAAVAFGVFKVYKSIQERKKGEEIQQTALMV